MPQVVPSFFRLGALLSSESASLSIATPAGTLLLQAAVGAISLTAREATSFVDATRSIHIWDIPDGRAELLLAPPRIALPPGMSIDGALAALWRVKVERESSMIVDVTWTATRPLTAEGPQSGENLDAQGWTDDHTRVLVGLPDYEASTSYEPDGFHVSRVLSPNVMTEVQCVCAWRQRSEDGLPLWFAVDRRPSDIVGDLAPVG